MARIIELFVAITVLAVVVNCEVKVQLTTDGPGVLDLPITFQVKLVGGTSEDEFYYQFQDFGVWPPHSEVMTGGSAVNWTIVYPSKTTFVGEKEMKVQVFAYIWGFKGWLIGEKSYRFNLSNSLTLAVNISQADLSRHAIMESIVATNRSVVLTALINDVSRLLNASNSYTWTLDDRTFGPNTYPELNYTFKANKSYPIEVVVMSNITLGSQVVTKLGKYNNQITAKNEIQKFNVSGNTWLKDGALLNLQVNCSGGDPPYWYCYDFFDKLPANYSCERAMFETNECYFPITHYFRKNGTHYLEIVISNDINFKQKSIVIKVYEIVRTTQLTFVIIPIMSSIVAIVIVVVAIAYHLQQRHRYNITLEVADFDFQYNENMIEKTFFERLRESLASAIRETFFYPCNPCTRAANYDDMIDDLLPEDNIRNNNQRTGINTNPVSYGIGK